MKIWIGRVVPLLALMVVAVVSQAATFTVGNASGICGDETVVVPVSIDNAAGLTALEIDLAFDSAKVVATSARATTLTSGWTVIANTDTPGVIRIAAANDTAIASGTGAVLEVLFDIPLTATSGSSVLDLQNATANEAAATAVDASFAVTCTPAGVRGDANGNGSLDPGDIFFLINSLFAGGAAPIGNGDANSNGSIDPGDIFFMINHLFAGGPAPTP